MDSPESTIREDTAVNATDVASNSPQVQESPFSNFLSSFSPLEFKNVSRMSHGFLGLSSPPLIFTTPRVNPDRESNFLPRSQNAELSTAEASQEDARLNKAPQETGDWDNSHLGMPESSGVNNCEHIQHSSSSEQVDKYLADPVEGECSEYLIDQNLKQLELGFQISKANTSIATDSQGRTIEPENRSVGKAEDDASNVLTKIGEPEPKELVLFDGRQTENKEGENMSELNHGHCIDAEFQYNSKFSSFTNGGSGDRASEPMQNAQALEDCPNAAEPILNRSVSNMMLDSEVNQQHRGMSRRCLQFEEALPKAAINTSFLHATRDANFSKSASTSAECNTFDSNASFCSRQLINVSQPMNNSSSHPDNGKLIFPLAKPLGIGLHLNSIVKTVPIGCDATLKISDGSMSIQEMKSEATAENKTIVEASGSPICESLQAFEALMQTVDEHATPQDKRKFSPEDPNNIEHCIDQNPKSKKKKLSNDPDDDGCKRCNCKKTKCLKLYCDCFAAGIYCDDTCSCQGCLNRVEHAETVLETRRQIESRNPLAFAPKIVQRGSEFPTKNMGDENLTTPSSARHKRGCNCKKSMCTKKYCECYQGNVGCSSGCRCENCQNVYGKKDDYVPEELMSSRVVVEKSECDDNMDIVVTKNNSAQAHLGNNMHKLTPITPSFGYLDHGKGGPKSQIIVRRFHPSHSTTQRNPDDEIPTEVSQTGFEHPPSRFGSVINASNSSTSASLGGSLCWRSKKSPEFTYSGAELMNILENYDETPEILTEGSTKTPTKISSPNRKRVSPLKQQRRRKEMGSSSSNTSSGPLRSGRKFVLRGVPSFPSLTPCAESKMLVQQQKQHGSADSQQSGDDKP